MSGKSTGSEEFEDVIELAVDVSADGDWTGDGLDIGLFEEDLFGHFAYNSEITLMKAFGVQ